MDSMHVLSFLEHPSIDGCSCLETSVGNLALLFGITDQKCVHPKKDQTIKNPAKLNSSTQQRKPD
jgi:hypothetical protein